MSDKQSDYNAYPENRVIIPTAPGSNPSSFPRYEVPIDPTVDYPERPNGEDSIELPGTQGDDFSGVPGRRSGGDYIDLPDGSHIAPNGAVIRDPRSDVPEVRPDHEYTPEKEDLNLMIL